MTHPESRTTTVAIIGAGPIGIELAISLQQAGVDAILFEAKQIGDAFTKWPPNTHFYSTPEHVALAGIPVQNVNQLPISGEEYLAYLRMLVEQFDLDVHVYEPVTDIQRQGEGFRLKTKHRTGERSYLSRYVVLATGGMAGPRLLGIPGEDLPHVSHTFPGPHPYFRTSVLIVGGMNSALESALRCWRVGAEVTLSHRRPELNFERIKPHLTMDIITRIEKGEIAYLPSTVPVAITPEQVVLAKTDADWNPTADTFTLDPDFVLLHTGFVADMRLFRQAGIKLEGREQAPMFDERTMETNVPGLFVAGTAAGGTQFRFQYFISTSHDHVGKIVLAITGQPPAKLGTVPSRNNAVSWEEVKAN